MQLRFHCPTDLCVAIIEFEPLEACGPTIRCPRCKVEHAVNVSDAVRNDRFVDRCVLCGATDMFVRKDFPQRLGLAVVVVFGIASIYYYRRNTVWSWLILAAAVVLDLIIYLVIGKVTTCYACRAEYRGCSANRAHEGFDLATSEKY